MIDAVINRFLQCSKCNGIIMEPVNFDAGSRYGALDSMGLHTCPHCYSLVGASVIKSISLHAYDIPSDLIVSGVWCEDCNRFSDGTSDRCSHCSSERTLSAYRSKDLDMNPIGPISSSFSKRFAKGFINQLFGRS